MSLQFSEILVKLFAHLSTDNLFFLLLKVFVHWQLETDVILGIFCHTVHIFQNYSHLEVFVIFHRFYHLQSEILSSLPQVFE